MQRKVIGCMTGTSIDALDAAMVRVSGHGLGMRAEFVRGVTRPLGALGPRLRRLADQEPCTAREIAGLARDFALLHAEAVKELVAVTGGEPDLIAVHGQTVVHAPPVSWQLFNPAPLAEAVGGGVPVVFDLRAADLAQGGQGAPITPLADAVLFSHPRERRAVVNLGGFCNVTLLPARAEGGAMALGEIEGFDVCSCNQVLNAVARAVLRTEFDEGGRAAGAGGVLAEPLEDLMGLLASQSRAGRSLGTGDEAAEWVSRYRAHVAPNDLAATACEGVGQTIARRVQGVDRVLLAGGGVRNEALVGAIGGWASAKVSTVAEFGVPVEFREAACMAVLGALCEDGVPITLPGVTGSTGGPFVSGCWVIPSMSRRADSA